MVMAPPYYNQDGITLYQGSARDVLATLPAESAQTCVTSPPYWGLRDYGSEGQMGLEPTPEEYVANMVAVFREVRRVLREDGTLWLNLGDSYASTPPGNTTKGVSGSSTLHGVNGKSGTYRETLAAGHATKRNTVVGGLKPKDLVGIPWRVAFALQADGWYLRSDIIWAKPNPMPESVTDRPTKAHEYLFLLSKAGRYYYDHEAIKSPLKSTPEQYARAGKSVRENHQYGSVAGRPLGPSSFATVPKGANARTVWTIPTQPYPGAHFAVFPPKLIEPCIKAGARAGDTVLDPFVGSGTTAEVARDLGCKCVGIDLSSDYLDLGVERLVQRVLPFGNQEPV